MNNTAFNDVIVMLEFQNQWTKPGFFNWLVRREIKRQNTVQNAIRLTQAARARNIPILHAPLWVEPGNLKGLYAQLTRGLTFRKGSPKGDIDSRVLTESDIIIQGRTAFDAFTGSELTDVLRQYSDHRILFCGFATDQCVLKTIRSAGKLGFNAQLISDCSATFTKGIQEKTERKLADQVIKTSDLLGQYTE